MKSKGTAFLFVLSVLFATNQSLAANYGRLCASIKPDQWSVDPYACISPYERYRVWEASVLVQGLYSDEVLSLLDTDGELIESVEDLLY